MKALEILTAIKLENDVTIEPGAVVTLEQLVQNTLNFKMFGEKNAEIKKYPCPVRVRPFASLAAYQKGAKPIDGTTFKINYDGLYITSEQFFDEGIATIALNYVMEQLLILYPAKIHIIDID